MKTVFVLVLLASSAHAQFNKSDIDDLKADLGNYADSGCTNEQYAQSAVAIMGKYAAPISSSLTPEQAKIRDQLGAALSEIQQALLGSIMGNKGGCASKIRDNLKKLDALPTNSQPSQTPPPGSGGAQR